MYIPYHTSVRGVIFVSLIIIGLAVTVIWNSTKDKTAYEKSVGVITFFDKRYQGIRDQHPGDYRYIELDTYPYVFQIYVPNSAPTIKSINDLKIGDQIDIYYYETSDTRDSRVNRYVQFIDSRGQAYFKRNGFQQQLGYVIIGLGLLLNIIAYLFWKKGKLSW